MPSPWVNQQTLMNCMSQIIFIYKFKKKLLLNTQKDREGKEILKTTYVYRNARFYKTRNWFRISTF